jgi:hypothetical protein
MCWIHLVQVRGQLVTVMNSVMKVPVKVGEFLGQPRDYQLVKDSASYTLILRVSILRRFIIMTKFSVMFMYLFIYLFLQFCR